MLNNLLTYKLCVFVLTDGDWRMQYLLCCVVLRVNKYKKLNDNIQNIG